MDDKGNESNDVWQLKPNYSRNFDSLQPGTYDYRENFEKKLYYDMIKVNS